MSNIINVAIVDYIEPTDGSNALISGIAATLQSNLFTRKPNGSTFTATIAEIGSTGRYTITFTPDTVSNGTPWFWSTHYASPPLRFWESYDVLPAAADPAAIADAIAGIMDQSSTGYDAGTIGYEIHALFKRPVGSG